MALSATATWDEKGLGGVTQRTEVVRSRTLKGGGDPRRLAQQLAEGTSEGGVQSPREAWRPQNTSYTACGHQLELPTKHSPLCMDRADPARGPREPAVAPW